MTEVLPIFLSHIWLIFKKVLSDNDAISAFRFSSCRFEMSKVRSKDHSYRTAAQKW